MSFFKKHILALSFKILLISCLSTTSTQFIHSQQLSKAELSQLQFRHIGPVGNRLISAAGIPGDPMVYYVGAASGGIWKTEDGGLNWKPIFDDKPVHAIGALAVAPSDEQVIYAGTGEPFIRSNVSIGNGVWMSTDAGTTWNHIGLEKSGRIARIIVHPDDYNTIWVAAVGHAYAPQKERGVWKTTDGGKNWKQVLFVDENTGASDLAIDPENPRILYAGMWQLELKTWTRESGGPGSGLYMSTDGGESWNKLQGSALPKKPVGKIAVATTPANANVVYALIETGDGVPLRGEETESGELWRSDNKGKTWRLISYDRDLGGRQAYYTRCEVSTDDVNEIYFLSANFISSIDGGKTKENRPFLSSPNWDHHHMWIDPSDGDRMIVVGDGGLSISQNRGKSWHRVQLPVAQLYHVTTDKAIPYNVLTNRQDGPSMKGPSRTRVASMFGTSFIPTGLWHDVSGGESGFATADPTNPDVIWSSASGYGPLGGIVTRYNEKSGQFRHLEVWPEMTAGSPAKDIKYRFQWTFPLLISPHNNKTIYVTSQHVHRTTNDGQSWEVISPDLSMNDKSKQGFSGGLTGDNIAVEYANVIYALDESPIQEGILWAGTNDGLVHVSRDGGENWTDVTKNIPNLPTLGVVRNIDASKYEVGKAYITVDRHQLGDFKPYVYKTANFGNSWTKITDSIPESNLSYTRNIKEDPVRPGLLYLGTENSLYISFNDGKHWQSLMTNLPHTPMYWIDIPEHFNDLVIGTYGRGIWILDDITPIQQMSDKIENAAVHLFDPKPAYRFRPVSQIMQFFPEASFGQDPKAGASIHYWLSEPNDSIQLFITNAEGDTVRTIKHKGKAGINRIWWNMNGELSDEIKLRTKPLYADWYPMKEDRTRTSPIGRFSVLNPPGTYQVHLEGGKEKMSTSIEIIKDPHSEGTIEDIIAQNTLLQALKSDMNEVAKMINQLEKIRRQIYDMKDLMVGDPTKKSIVMEITKLDSTLLELEGKMIQLKLTNTGQDQIRFPAKLAGKIAYLAGTVQTADFPPTDEQIQVHQLLRDRKTEYQKELEELIKTKMAAFKSMLEENGVGPILLD